MKRIFGRSMVFILILCMSLTACFNVYAGEDYDPVIAEENGDISSAETEDEDSGSDETDGDAGETSGEEAAADQEADEETEADVSVNTDPDASEQISENAGEETTEEQTPENAEVELTAEETPENTGETESEEVLSDEENTEESFEESTDETTEKKKIAEDIDAKNAGVSMGTEIKGTFAAVSGKDVATIRYYTDEEKTEYAFCEFSVNAEGQYDYSFEAPFDGFTAVQGTDAADANIIAEYYDLNVWDGTVDVSWYDASASEYHIYYPAQLAGAAAIVNGSVDSSISDFNVKGARSDLTRTANRGLPDCIRNEYAEETELGGPVSGPAYVGLAENDFSGKVIYLESDMNMGGMDGATAAAENLYEAGTNLHDGTHEGYAYYPNWTPIGGLFLTDLNDPDTCVKANFNGVFEGCGHYIYNLYCYRWAYPHPEIAGYTAYGYAESTGLIGQIGYLYSEDQAQPALDPAVRNLGLDGFVYGRRSVGGIVGRAGAGDYFKGKIYLENLVNKATVLSTDSKGVAGIVGTFWNESIQENGVTYARGGEIINCYNRGYIRQCEYSGPAGGIIGENSCADIYCCYNTGGIYSTAKMGRGIGADSAGRNYTVSDCYYLEGNYDCDVEEYYGYYFYESDSSVNVSVLMMNASQMTDGSMLNALNVNGTAYAAGADGYPVLIWETGGGSGTYYTVKPEGGNVSSDTAEGSYSAGKIIYLTNEKEDGWSFRYYTLNYKQVTGSYITVNGNCEVSALYQKSGTGVLVLPNDPVCIVNVYRVEADNSKTQLFNGDSVLEGDYLTVEASIREGVVPDDPDYEYRDAVGLDHAYTYNVNYSGTDISEDMDPTDVRSFEVSDLINAQEAKLTVTVTAEQIEKLWKNQGDTSWYDENSKEFTLTTAAELAGLDRLVEQEITFEGVTIRLGSDISLQNTDGSEGNRYWDGIGSSTCPFAGNFDGQGHKITDMKGIMNGLFARVIGASNSNRSEIKDVEVYGSMKGYNASGIAGYTAFTNITDCSNYCVIDGSQYAGICYCGGIVGNDAKNTTVTSCVNYASVSGSYRVGGIVGSSTGTTSFAGTIQQCINKGEIICMPPSTSSVFAGGIAGETNGVVQQCANTGTVRSGATAAGGILGSMRNQGTSITAYMKYCYNAGDVIYCGSQTGRAVGGLIGRATRFVAVGCHNVGSVSSEDPDLNTVIGSFAGTYTTNTNNKTTNIYCLDDSCDYVLMNMTIDQVHELDKTDVDGLYTASAAEFASETGVISVINDKSYYTLTNGEYPTFAAYETLHVHTGGTATCSEQAVCEVCGLHYGETDPDNHSGTEIRNAVKAEWVFDGYTGDTYCSGCGELLAEGESIPADTAPEVFTVNITCKDAVLDTKIYTIAEFDALASTDTAGYQYGSGFKTCVASNRYVTLESMLADFGYSMDELVSAAVISTASSEIITKERLLSENIYMNEDGTTSTVPAAIGIYYDREQGTADSVVQNARLGPFILMYGIKAEDIENDYVGGFRLITPVVSVSFEVEEDELTGISLASGPKYTAYHTGDCFSAEDLVIEGIYASGAKHIIRNYTVDKTDQLNPDDKVVTVSYGGYSLQLDITVSDHHYDPLSHLCTETRYDGSVCGTEDPDKPVPVESVTLYPEEADLPAGNTLQLTAAVSPENAGNKNIRWSSSDEETASVSEDGLVTAHIYSREKVTITASTEDGNLTASCVIQTRFSDVPDSSFKGYTYVYWAAEQGVVTGKDGGVRFAPKDNCTRAQMVMILWKMNGSVSEKGTLPFTDVTADRSSKTYKSILWAYKNGIVTGTGDGTTFSPNDGITRAQIAVMLYRMAGKPEIEETWTNPFTDLTGSSGVKKAITWLYNTGIAKGTGETSFSPKTNCTRVQLVTFLYKYCRLINS